MCIRDSYYTVQRTCQARLFGDGLAAFTFWGWQALIICLLVTLPQGLTTTKEYAEVEFTGAVWMGIVWVAYAVVFFGTVMKRSTPHIYVGNWFFGAFILVTTMLHVVNAASSNGSILAVMFFAVMFGVGMVLTPSESTATLKRGIEGIFEISMTLIGLVIRLAPYAVFCFMFNLAAIFGLSLIHI